MTYVYALDYMDESDEWGEVYASHASAIAAGDAFMLRLYGEAWKRHDEGDGYASWDGGSRHYVLALRPVEVKP